MKKFFKVRSIVAMFIMVTLATTAFAGCNQSTNQETVSSSTVSEVRQDEKSKVESKVEISKDEKSKAESKVESSKDEKSKVESSKEEPSKVETSKEESSKVEKSEVETSAEPSKSESSVEESSREVSKVESSAEESSKEVSKAESSVTEPSKVESSVEVSKVEESSHTVSVKDAKRYGQLTIGSIIYDCENLSDFDSQKYIPNGSLICILNINDTSAYDSFFGYPTYEILFLNKRYAIPLKNVKIFSEDYVPDFTDEHWVGLS